MTQRHDQSCYMPGVQQHSIAGSLTEKIYVVKILGRPATCTRHRAYCLLFVAPNRYVVELHDSAEPGVLGYR